MFKVYWNRLERSWAEHTAWWIAGFSFIYCIAFLQLPFRWWYIDDALQFHVVSQHGEPFGFFFDREILKNFGNGVSVVPVFLSSLWIDETIFGSSPFWAYMHSVLSITLTAIVFFHVIRHLTQSRFIASIIALMWLALPTSVVTMSWISARHYVEGLLFAGMVYVLSVRGHEERVLPERRKYYYTLIAVFALLSLLSKEMLLMVVPSILFFLGWKYKDVLLITMSIGSGLFLVLYRYWLFRTDSIEGLSYLSMVEYIEFILKLPFTLSASWLGHLFTIMVISILVIQFQKMHQDKRLFVLIFIFILSILFIYPVATGLDGVMRIPQHTYRYAFFVNVMALTITAVALQSIKYRMRLMQTTAAGFLVIILLGGIRANQEMLPRYQLAEVEGKFYISNPDKLLYSQEEIGSMTSGLDQLYQLGTLHYLPKNYVDVQNYRDKLSQFETIWRYEDGEMIQDDMLYQQLVDQYLTPIEGQE